VISRNPATIQLRYLQTLSEIGVNQNSTVVFPLPMNLINPLLKAAGEAVEEREPAPQSEPAPGELPPGNGAGDLGGLTAPVDTEEAEARER
jgi:hypothetical protein